MWYRSIIRPDEKRFSFQTLAWPVGFETTECRDRLGNDRAALIDVEGGGVWSERCVFFPMTWNNRSVSLQATSVHLLKMLVPAVTTSVIPSYVRLLAAAVICI